MLINSEGNTSQINILHEKKEQLEFAIEAAELVTWDLNPVTNKFTANARYFDWFGIPENVDDNDLAISVIAAEDRDRVISAYKKALDFSSNSKYDIEYTIRPPNRPERILRAKGKTWFNEAKEAVRFTGTLQDVTEQAIARRFIEENQQHLGNIISQVNAGIVLADATGIFKEANDRFCVLTGYSIDELRKLSIADITHPDDIQQNIVLIKGCLNEGKSFFLEKRYIKKDGSIVWVNNSVSLVIRNGTEKFISAVSIDITDQVKSRKIVEESEERFRSLADQSPMIVFIVEPNPEATMSYFNKTWLDYTGQTFKEAIGRAWNGIVHPNDVQSVYDLYIPALQQRQPYTLPAVRIKRFDGEYRWHTFKGNPRYLSTGEFIGYVGIGLDIHERQLAEEALKESTEHFSTLANNIQNLAWMADGEGWIFWYNKRWYEYTGTTLEEMQGWGWEKVHHPDYIDRVVEFVQEAWLKNEPFELTFPLRAASGEYRRFLTRAFPITNAEGKIVKWIGTNTDIEEQQTIAEKLENLVEKRTMELQRSNDDLQQFAHVTSHDLKEPVRKIKIFSDLLAEDLKDRLTGKSKTYLDKVQTAASRIFTMIDGVLAYSSINSSDNKHEHINLNDVLKNIQSDLEVIILEKQAVIKSDDLPVIEGDPILINQLFYNLLNNSLKFSKTDETTKIVISLKMIKTNDKEGAQITLRDNGIGFDQDQSVKIFDTFSRLNSKDKYEGTGLGLALCKKIVQRHNGTIEALGVRGEGACFTITLPLKQE